MARAAKPIFSPSCGLTRMIAGAGVATVGADLGKAAFVGACLLLSTLAFTMEAHSFCVSENLAPPTPPNPFFDPQRVFAGDYPREINHRRFSSLFSGGAHEKEVSLMRRAVRFEWVRQAPKILLKMR